MTALRSLIAFLSIQAGTALIPATPGEQTRRAITSVKDTISKIRLDNRAPPRIYVDYLIPLPPATTDADIDPWPGGLAQQYSYAEDILKDLLTGVVDDSKRDKCSSQVISDDDCCGLFIQESPESPELDVAAILFPSPDQLSNIKEIEEMVGDRTLLIFNKQYTRSEDFGFFKKGEAAKVIEKYEYGFAFQEIACRGEDVKLTYEQSIGWQCRVIDENGNEIVIKNDNWDNQVRPDYQEIEDTINEVIKEPLWMRKMQEASTKGLKFTRNKI